MNSVELEHIATKKRKLHETSGNSNKEHKFKALLSDNKYRIRVRSVNMMGNSEWTDWKLTTTKKRDVPIVKIPTPMNLETETIVNDSKSFHLKWSSNNKRKKKQKNQKNINNKNKQTNDGTQEKNNIQYYIHLDCDDGEKIIFNILNFSCSKQNFHYFNTNFFHFFHFFNFSIFFQVWVFIKLK